MDSQQAEGRSKSERTGSRLRAAAVDDFCDCPETAFLRHWGGWKKLRMAAGGTYPALQSKSAGENKKDAAN